MCTKPFNRTQFPREYSPLRRDPISCMLCIIKYTYIPHAHAGKGWDFWFEKLIAGRQLDAFHSLRPCSSVSVMCPMHCKKAEHFVFIDCNRDACPNLPA